MIFPCAIVLIAQHLGTFVSASVVSQVKHQVRVLPIDSDIFMDTKFLASEGPFIFRSACTIHPGVKLTIEAGSVLLFERMEASVIVRGPWPTTGKGQRKFTNCVRRQVYS